MDELNAPDGEETARRLIESGSGVVYDSGMKLEQFYDGRFFPCYYYEPNVITVAVTSKSEPEEDGMFTDRGYVDYKGYISIEEVMNGSQSSRMEMGGML